MRGASGEVEVRGVHRRGDSLESGRLPPAAAGSIKGATLAGENAHRRSGPGLRWVVGSKVRRATAHWPGFRGQAGSDPSLDCRRVRLPWSGAIP